ncbi:heavy-metal-associated domain-containing protein [Arhodomonas sp. AD133]|uniref:heavy-metal-associated domain-containing protein n=1 Tax=Arhodomonas sp. AD133 TaxID=3415009 RepID=UPI003EB6B96A
MNPMYRLLPAVCLMVIVTPLAVAAERTVTLDVANMSCASCSYIVEQALSDVPGVTAATASLEDKTATVTFDDTQTGIAALTRTTANAGYPAQPQE